VQGALDAGPIVLAKGTDLLYNVIDIRLGDLSAGDYEALAEKAGFRLAPQVKHHLQKLIHIVTLKKQFSDMRGNRFNQRFKVRVQLCL